MSPSSSDMQVYLGISYWKCKFPGGHYSWVGKQHKYTTSLQYLKTILNWTLPPQEDDLKIEYGDILCIPGWL